MNQLRFYIGKFRMKIGQKNRPAGIPWLPGPGLHDLYPKPQMAFCWHQPGNTVSGKLSYERRVTVREWFLNLARKS